MLVPLVVLTVGAVAAGYVFHHAFIDADHGGAFWGGSLMFDAALMEAAHNVPLWVKWTPFAVMALGLGAAWLAYLRQPDLPARFVASFGALHRFVANKWFFDELYDLLFVRPAFALGRLFWKRGDEAVIDRFGPDGAAALVQGGTRLAARFQSGFLASYAFVMLIGLAALATWAMVMAR